MSLRPFVFEVRRVEEAGGEGEAADHRAILHGTLREGPADAVVPGAAVRLPSRQGGPLVARVVELRDETRLVVDRPVPLRRLVAPGPVEPCTEAEYDATLLDMLTDDRVRAVMHDRLSGPDHGQPEAFSPPACRCIEVLRGRRAALDILRAMLRSWEPENVSGAVQALAFFEAETCVPLLTRMLRHNVARVRFRAARALEPHRDHPDVAEALAGLASDPDPRLRRLR